MWFRIRWNTNVGFYITTFKRMDVWQRSHFYSRRLSRLWVLALILIPRAPGIPPSTTGETERAGCGITISEEPIQRYDVFAVGAGAFHLSWAMTTTRQRNHFRLSCCSFWVMNPFW